MSLKLHWFSPLPPERSGIALFSAQLLPLLAREAEITVWSEQETCEESVLEHAEFRPLRAGDAPWAEINRADVCVYNIGNNATFHSETWRLSRGRPGIVILHDLRLQHLFAAFFSSRDQFDEYRAHMRRMYGPAGDDAARAWKDGALSTENLARNFPLTALGVDGALAAVVHTQEGFDQLAEFDPNLAVTYAPLPYTPGASPGERVPENEKRAGTPGAGSPARVVVFGYLSPNRRLEPLLHALASLPEPRRFRLEIFGTLWDGNTIPELSHALGLERVVSVNGYVTEKELEAALARADLAVNLRHPTMGEASITQLRLWDHALPSLVTPGGWFAQLPEECVDFVRPTDEVEDLRAHLEAFLREPAKYAAKGRRGRRLLRERHSPENYARAVLDLCERRGDLGRVCAARTMVERAGAVLRECATPDSLSASATRTARAIAELAALNG